MIKFDGLLNEASLAVIRETLGYELRSVFLQKGTVSISDRFPVVAHNRFALAFANAKKHRYIIFNAHCFKPHSAIWEQGALKIQVIDPVYKPLKEKVLWPIQELDSSFSTSITNFDKETIVKQVSLYGNKIEGYFSKCFPDFTDEDLEDAKILSTEQVQINSIELIEILLTNGEKIYIILREYGFDLEINSTKQLGEITQEYFDDRYRLKCQHFINDKTT